MISFIEQSLTCGYQILRCTSDDLAIGGTSVNTDTLRAAAVGAGSPAVSSSGSRLIERPANISKIHWLKTDFYYRRLLYHRCVYSSLFVYQYCVNLSPGVTITTDRYKREQNETEFGKYSPHGCSRSRQGDHT